MAKSILRPFNIQERLLKISNKDWFLEKLMDLIFHGLPKPKEKLSKKVESEEMVYRFKLKKKFDNFVYWAKLNIRGEGTEESEMLDRLSKSKSVLKKRKQPSIALNIKIDPPPPKEKFTQSQSISLEQLKLSGFTQPQKILTTFFSDSP